MAKFWTMALVAALACIIGIGSASAADKKPGADKPKPTPEEMFKKLDKDGDGKLTLAELVGKKEGKQKEAAEAQFKKLDKNGDGAVTLDEYKTPAKPAGKKAKK